MRGKKKSKEELKKELQEARKRYRQIFEIAKVGIVVHDRNGKIIDANPEAEKALDNTEKELRKKDINYWEGKIYKENGELMKPSEFPVSRVFDTGKPTKGDVVGILGSKQDEIKWYIHGAAPLFDEKENIDKVMTSFIEITKQIRMENQLKRSEEKYRSFFQTSRDAVFITSKQGHWLDMNDAAVKLFGYKNTQELSKVKIPDLYEKPEDRKRHIDIIEKKGFTKDYAVNLKKKNDQVINTLITSVVIKNNSGEVIGFQGTIKDITERKKAEEKIKKSLQEKEVMLREIHHRVKNNLQIVTSLLRIQARFIQDRKAKQAFKESQSRIYSMSLVHEKLYKSQDYANIDLGLYIQNFVTHLFHTYEVDTSRIEMSTDTENVHVDINKAIPCGLILNELVSNALKHAFPCGQKGKLSIKLRKSNNRKISLSVKDNGKGLPKGINIRHPKSLGLQLIKDLTMQLHGDLKVRRENGTQFTIYF